MNPSEYIIASARTKSNTFRPKTLKQDTIHGAIGLASESGELMGAIKKAMFYEQIPDLENIKEEVGDCLWYIARILEAQNWTMEEVMNENINKLKLRYPDKFTHENSIERKDKNETKTI